MTAPFGGFPGGMPGGGFSAGGPGAPQQQASGFVLNIPADPNWEPMQMSDVLDKDGYYQARIVDEKPRNDGNSPQLILTLELLDQDVVGKILSKFMPHAETTTKNTWFLWRGLLRSIGGSSAHGKQAFQYQLGCLKGQIVYFKTEPYVGKDGTVSTSVADWCLKTDWEEAHKTGRARWAPKLPQHMGGAGALPGGVPGGFGGGMPALPGAPGGMPGIPGGGFPGLPGGMPGGPSGVGVPTPPGMPMQQPTVIQPQVPQQPMQPQMQQPMPQQPMFSPQPMQQVPTVNAPPPPAIMAPAFPQQPVAPSGFTFPQNGAAVPQPAPTAAGIAASFPGLPGAK